MLKCITDGSFTLAQQYVSLALYIGSFRPGTSKCLPCKQQSFQQRPKSDSFNLLHDTNFSPTFVGMISLHIFPLDLQCNPKDRYQPFAAMNASKLSPSGLPTSSSAKICLPSKGIQETYYTRLFCMETQPQLLRLQLQQPTTQLQPV